MDDNKYDEQLGDMAEEDNSVPDIENNENTPDIEDNKNTPDVEDENKEADAEDKDVTVDEPVLSGRKRKKKKRTGLILFLLVLILAAGGAVGYYMYLNEQEFYAGEGIVAEGIDRTIENIGILGKEGMKETNKKIIEMMIK